MNDDALPPELLASGYLDGELTEDERARVEADPALRALVDAHAAARDALATPVVPLTEEERDALIATALSAAPSGDATVIPLAPRRGRRWLQAAAGVAAAAAAVAVTGLILHARSGNQSSGSTAKDTITAQEAAPAGGGAATTAAAGTAAAPALAPAATEAPATEAAGSTTSPPAPLAGVAPPTTVAADAGGSSQASAVEDLGPLDNRSEFIAAARRFKTTAVRAGAGPCPDYPPPLAKATFQGTPAYLVVIEALPSGNRVALVATDTCAVLVKADLAES
jgi:hypothetical protein